MTYSYPTSTPDRTAPAPTDDPADEGPTFTVGADGVVDEPSDDDRPDADDDLDPDDAP